MRESSLAQAAHLPDSANITDHLERQAEQAPENPLFAVQRGGEWVDVPARQFREEVIATAKGLIARGVKTGDRVAIMASTRYEWSLVDFAVWYAGAISVPIYETSSVAQAAWILEDAGVMLAIVGTDGNKETVTTAIDRNNLTAVTDVLVMDHDLDALRAAGADISEATVEEARSSNALDDISSIIYTSGTTGSPKGCKLTHRNFAELSMQTILHLDNTINRDTSTLLFLPLAHMFARIVAIVCMASGATMGHGPDLSRLVDDFGSFRPTFVLGVPRIFEKVYNSALLTAESTGKGKIFRAAEATAVEWSKAKMAGRVPPVLALKRAIFARLVYSKIHARLGRRVDFALSGGSPLGKRLAHFYDGIGLTILEGYGLTETTGPVTLNRPGKVGIGTVGTVLPGNAVRIAEDGEVQSRGLCNFAGYWNRPDLEGSTFDADGWYDTGDFGSLDDDGYLTIIGRKKEILVTSGGKNVSPNQLEDRIRADAIVSQAVVVGDNRPYLAALLTLDSEVLPLWLQQFGVRKGMLWEEQIAHPEVQKHLQAVIDYANESVSRAESVRRFCVLPEDFTIASGMLTPSLKLRRPQVMSAYGEVVDELYAQKKV